MYVEVHALSCFAYLFSLCLSLYEAFHRTLVHTLLKKHMDMLCNLRDQHELEFGWLPSLSPPRMNKLEPRDKNPTYDLSRKLLNPKNLSSLSQQYISSIKMATSSSYLLISMHYIRVNWCLI